MLLSCNVPSAKQKTTAKSVPLSQDTLGLTPDFSYEVVEQTPYILIDKEGYLPDRKKTVFVLGTDITPEFTIRHAVTGEIIYQGVLQKVGKSSKSDKDIYMGDFTPLSANGLYEVYQEQVGYSYPFYINKMVYRTVSDEMYDKVEAYSYEMTSELCYVLSNVMLTNEIYKDTQENKQFIRKQIETLLLQQEDKTGAVCQMIQTKKNEGLDISLSATAEFAGVLAQYYYNYKEDDPQFALMCLQASTQAYRYIEKYRDNISTDSWYYASTQLYRITGQYKHKTAIKEYDNFPIARRSVSDYDYTMQADIAYMSTNFRTDILRCRTIMDQYMERAQEISEDTAKDSFYVMKNIDTISQTQVIQDMKLLGIVNYVLSGREYAGIQENYIHYLFGVNEETRNRITQSYFAVRKREPMEHDITRVSELIFILGNVSHK